MDATIFARVDPRWPDTAVPTDFLNFNTFPPLVRPARIDVQREYCIVCRLT
jgi:hypothetical protein